MNSVLVTVAIRYEHDVVLARQRARQLASLLGFETQDQVRIATAVSEIARNAFHYAGGGRVEFAVRRGDRPALQVRVTDQGPGIPNLQAVLDGQYTSATGMGLGIVGARRLMDEFDINSTPGRGTSVQLGKRLRPGQFVDPETMARLVEELALQAPGDPFEEIQRQNQELLATMQELEQRQSELAQVNRELEDTNRGVLALYAELDERADTLRRASELKSRFLSNMTHEFRTPLNSILSLTRMLLDRIDGELTEDQEKQVTFIQRAANDLSSLVNDLLDLARVEAGKAVVRVSEFRVGDLLGALRGTTRPLVAAKAPVALVFEEPPDLPPLQTDERKLSQILRNFISNALKYTERGEVRVSVAGPSPDEVAFSVADTGVGIAPEDQERVFEEFTQIDHALQERFKGTGLGLPLARRLAELLGGRVTLRSTPGVGSVFTVTVPRRYAGPAEMPLVSVAGEGEGEILVIDDDEVSRYLLKGLLAGSGCTILETSNGAEGILIARKRKPALVFLEVMMPETNGWVVLERLREDPRTRDIPVVVHTAKALGDAERRLLESRCLSILPKNHSNREASAAAVRQVLKTAGLPCALAS